jgi:EAL domain-containing protein (putative c-di-GMP-specific phosphodiesterase class I)/CheY-like chemotaxis protein
MLNEPTRHSVPLDRCLDANEPASDPVSATRATPLCYIADDEQGICNMISHTIREQNIVTMEFRSATPLLDAVAKSAPDLIFLDLSLEGSDAVDALRGLDLLGYRGKVQLISGRYSKFLNEVNQVGQRHSLDMLPVLSKPFRRAAIRNLIADLDLVAPRDPIQRQASDRRVFRDHRAQGAPASSVGLAEALSNDWLEFWYQPIMDLRSNCIAGAELLARVRHPRYGVLPPSAFLPNADADNLQALTERALITSLRDWPAFAEIGVPLKLAINVPVTALTNLPIPTLVRQYRPVDAMWPGIVLEVTEDQIIRDIGSAHEIATQLRLYDVGLSVDDFGSGYSSLARLQEIPFCELKLDRSFVTNCARDEMKAGLCQTIVDLAHRFGKSTVGEGIENAADLQLLCQMGCDMGQGFLIARPLPKDQFLSFLRPRAGQKQ